MTYGLPYKGSKNAIAEWVVRCLPRGRRLVDLFAGGGAVSHAALRSGKYSAVLANDADSLVVDYLRRAVSGQFDERVWVSSEDFARLRDSDPVVRYCWSFGMGGKSYLYGQQLETWKRAMHLAVLCGDYSAAERDFGVRLSPDVKARLARLPVNDACLALQNLLSAEHVSALCDGHTVGVTDTLESCRNVRRLAEFRDDMRGRPFAVVHGSYDAVPVEDGDVLYADIPYFATDGYRGGFDYARFYAFCRSNPRPVFVSEYSMPDEFICVAQVRKVCTFAGHGHAKPTIEKIFVHRRFGVRFMPVRTKTK